MSHGRWKRGALLAGCLCVVVFARSAGAQALFPPAPGPDPSLIAPPPAIVVDPLPSPTMSDPGVVVPEHLVIKNQNFEASVSGFPGYPALTATATPPLYAQLAPEADRLESRRTIAIAL